MTNGSGALGTGGTGGGGNATDGTTGGSGTVNTGSGGASSTGANLLGGGNGGSGVVILKYESLYTITIGAGLTGTTSTVGSSKITTITAGTGNVSWA
jgi:hypothetical protein